MRETDGRRMSSERCVDRDRADRGRAGGRGGRAVRVLAAAAVLAAAFLAAAGPAEAQQDPDDEARAPETAEAPTPFRLGPTVSLLSWEDGASTLDDVTLWGLAVEREVASFLAVRLDGGFGTGSLTDGDRTVGLSSYLAELALSVRPPIPPLARIGVEPYAVGGLGTVVHDPDDDELPTASQNALSWGIGVAVRPLDRLGARLEWRRYDVDLENLLDPTDRTGTGRRLDRFQAAFFWTF